MKDAIHWSDFGPRAQGVPEARRALNGNDTEARAQAITALVEAARTRDDSLYEATPHVLQILVPLARDVDVRTRASLDALFLRVALRNNAWRVGCPSEPLVRAIDAALAPAADEWIPRLESDDVEARIVTAAFLGCVHSRGEAIVPALQIRIEAEADPEARTALLLALRSQRAFDPRTVRSYEASLRDPNEQVATAAALALRDYRRSHALSADTLERIPRALTPMRLRWMSDFEGFVTELPEPVPAPVATATSLEDATVLFAAGETVFVEHPTRGRFRFQFSAAGLAKGDRVRIGDFVDEHTVPRALELEWTPPGGTPQRLRFDTNGKRV